MKKSYILLHETWHANCSPLREGEVAVVRLIFTNDFGIMTRYLDFRWRNYFGSVECRIEIDHRAWKMLEEFPEIMRWMRRFNKEQDCDPTVENLLTWLKMQGFQDQTYYNQR